MKLLNQYCQGWQSILAILSRKKPLFTLLSLYPLMLWIFVYFTNLNLFAYVLRSNDLTAADKAGFIWQALANIFKNAGDPLALSVIIFAFLATVNVVILIDTIKARRSGLSGGQSAAFLAVAGSHCVACGGSLLAPIVTALVGSGAYISAARANTTILIALTINLLAILLITHVTLKNAASVRK